MDGSAGVWRFIEAHVPARYRSILENDLDLPLQAITRERNRPALERCLFEGGIHDFPALAAGDDGDDDSLEVVE